MPRIIFFGTDDFSVPSLRALIEKKIVVATVVTKPDAPSGRGKQLSKPPVAIAAQECGINVLQPEELDDDFLEQLKQIEADIGVLVSYGKILPKEVIDIFPHGIINVHPSLLPKYRGPSPIEAAILNGDKVTGVTLMELDNEMDAGPIYLQDSIKLDQTETRTDLYEKLSTIGANMLSENLEAIISGGIKATPQHEGDASYTRLILKTDGLLSKDVLDQPAENIERMIRAYKGWPGVRLEDNTQIIDAKISPVKVPVGEINTATRQMLIGTAGSAIEVIKLKPSGKNEMGVEDYLRGLRA